MSNTFPRLRSAAALAAALSVLGLVPAPTSAAPEPARGTTTPVVGDCHALTVDEGAKASDPDAPVDCTAPHTSVTVRVVQLTNPDWSDVDKIGGQISAPCFRSWIEKLGGNTKKVRMSAYAMYWFVPTKAEREAGATWVRCDAVLLGGRKFIPLPSGSDITLGSLPLTNKFAKCRAGKRSGYQVLSCSRRHVYRAKIAIRYPDGAYPGKRAATRWALRKCSARLNTAFYYEPVLSKFAWNKLGYRHAICLPKTRS